MIFSLNGQVSFENDYKHAYELRIPSAPNAMREREREREREIFSSKGGIIALC